MPLTIYTRTFSSNGSNEYIADRRPDAGSTSTKILFSNNILVILCAVAVGIPLF